MVLDGTGVACTDDRRACAPGDRGGGGVRRRRRPALTGPDRGGAWRPDRTGRPARCGAAATGCRGGRRGRLHPAARRRRRPRAPRLLPAGGGPPRRGDHRAGPRLAGTAVPVRDGGEAAAAVAMLAAAGAAVIKVALDGRVGPTLPGPLLAAVVAAARQHGLGVTAHVAGNGEVEKALAAGVGELAHWPLQRRVLDERLIARLAASVTVVPTLHIEPSRARRRGVRRFIAMGGRVVYGTDLGNQGPPPAVDVEELRLLVEAGLAPGQALAAATSVAAAHLGLADVGRVVPGARADLLLVEGDPLADLAALTRVRLVTRDGWGAEAAGG